MVSVPLSPTSWANALGSFSKFFERPSSGRISAGAAWSAPTELKSAGAMRVQIPSDLSPAAADKLVRSLGKLVRFRSLDEAWDGRQGKPLSPEAALVAVRVLIDVAAVERPTPQLVPLPSGGVQVEWHVGGNDLEIEVDAKGDLHVLAVTPTDEVAIDREVSPVFFDSAMIDVRRFLNRMSRQLQGS